MEFASSLELTQYYTEAFEKKLGIKLTVAHFCGRNRRSRDDINTIRICTAPINYYKTLNVATFSIEQLPMTSAYGVLCDAKIFTEFQGRKLAELLSEMWIDMARLLGYSALLCSSKFNESGEQSEIFTKNGWKGIYSVKSKRTNRHIGISIVEL